MGDKKPEWLPLGWKIKVKVRVSGRKDKYYIDPVSGRHFRSMPEVARYIESKDSGEAMESSSSGEAKEQSSIDKKQDKHLKSGAGAEVIGPTNVDMQREKEDGFVDGDLVNNSPQIDAKEQDEGGSRRSLRIAGRKKRNFVTEDQYSQLVCKRKRKNQSRRCTSDLLGRSPKIFVQIETENPCMEVKTGEKSGVSATLPDKAEVTTVKDGQLDEALIDDANAKIGNDRVNNEDHLVRQKRIRIPNRKYGSSLLGRTSKGFARVEIKRPSMEVKTSNKSGVLDESEVTTTKNVVKDGVLDEALTNAKISENPVNNDDQHKNLVSQKRRRIPNRKYGSDLPGRTSKGLAQIETKHPSLEVNTSNKSGVSSDESEVTTARNVVKDGPPLIGDINAKISNVREDTVNNQGCHKNLACQKRRKILNRKYGSGLPGRTSKGLAQVEVKGPPLVIKTSNKSGISATQSDESVVTAVKDGASNEPLIDDGDNGKNGNPANNQEKTTSHDFKEGGRESEKLNIPLEELLMDPCIEFAFKILTDVIPIEEVSKLGSSIVSSVSLPAQTPSPMLPSSQIRSDPCFEFAVKTLTGENVKDPSHPHAASGSSQNTVGARQD